MPAPKPVDAIVIIGIGPQRDTFAASSAAPVGVVSSAANVHTEGRRTAQQLDDSRRRVREQAVSGAHHPYAVGHGARMHFVDAEELERCARADDVDDRVEAADLVEVHLLGGTAVEMAFGLRERIEGSERRVAALVRAAGLLR